MIEACENRPRAACKIVGVLAGLIAIVALLSHLISERDLETLKHSLSLWTLVALVVIVNIVSGLTFAALFAAWQWVRRDLKPHRAEDDRLDDN